MHSQACSHMQSTPLVHTRPQQTLLYSTLVYTKTCTRRAVRRTGCEPTSSASPTVPSCYMICELPLRAAQECGGTQDVKETHLGPHWQGSGRVASSKREMEVRYIKKAFAGMPWAKQLGFVMTYFTIALHRHPTDRI